MLIFAYGSNMCAGKLHKDVPSAKAVATCRLGQHVLRFHKPSALDGSGKADAFETRDGSDEVWGVVYEIDPAERPALDRTEGLGQGYDLKQVRVVADDGAEFEALAYVATSVDESLRPYDWYKRYVVEGAKQHCLPDSYLAKVEAVEAGPDPDATRAAQHWAVVC